MDRIKASLLAVFWAVLVSGCASVGVDSQNYRATVLYFEGGSGEIRHGNRNFLINRCSAGLRSEGIVVKFMPVRHGLKKVDLLSRLTAEHFDKIQRRVDALKAKGHERVWLMGISNGTLSVMDAGVRQIEGVDGLIIINPRRDMYSAMINAGTYTDFRSITLPVLVLVHEADHSNMKGLSPGQVAELFRRSPHAKLVVFSGGMVGEGGTATHLTQKYQHGLRGLEDEFIREVVSFLEETATASTVR